MVQFGKKLNTLVQNEWKPHAVAYESLKSTLSGLTVTADDNSVHTESSYHISDVQIENYFSIYEDSIKRLTEFYESRSNWADEEGSKLERLVEKSSSKGEVDELCNEEDAQTISLLIPQILDFSHDLLLILDFLELNVTAFSKIMKKFDKRTSSCLRETKLKELKAAHPYLYEGGNLRKYKKLTVKWIDELRDLLQVSSGQRPFRRNSSHLSLNHQNSIIRILSVENCADIVSGDEQSQHAPIKELKGTANDENPQGIYSEKTGVVVNDFKKNFSSGSVNEEDDSITQEIILRVQTELGLQASESPFFSSLSEHSLPLFSSSQVEIDRLLGQGEFCKIYEVINFNLCGFPTKQDKVPDKKIIYETVEDDITKELQIRPKTASNPLSDFSFELDANSSDCSDLESDHQEEGDPNSYAQTRGFMKDHCFRNGEARYAIKRIRNSLVGDDIVDALIDLAREGEFLSNMSHPNIIKVRGTVSLAGNPKYALILDRLCETLDTRIKCWRVDVKKSKGKLMGVFKKKKQVIRKLWQERLVAGYDLANAIGYMHSRNILHRDLKPDNIGFDIRGTLKVFDLGLAKELKPCDREGDDEYRTSGMAGTRRYMPPEVINILPYGLSSDVYSFAICFYEMMSLVEAYASYSRVEHYKNVVSEGKRPKLPSSWPTATKDFLQLCWHQEPRQRPSFNVICSLIKGELPEDMSCNRVDELMLCSERSHFQYDTNFAQMDDEKDEMSRSIRYKTN